jgi:hypothetical protein
MGNSRRNTRRHRREPIRRAIPASKLTGVLLPSRRRTDDRPQDRMPVFAYSPLFTLIVEAPVELVPMYAVLAVLHQKSSGLPVGTCVPTSYQISGALEHFGFRAEPMAACASVHRATDTFTEISDVGVSNRPPVVFPDGTTTGHMIVWTSSFGHLIDATLVQDPTLLAAAHHDPLYSMPVFMPVPADRAAFLRTEPVLALDERLHVSWVLRPEWTAAMEPVLDGPMGLIASLGALALATDALEVVRDLGDERDLSSLPARYPRLGRLLAGQERLPSLPDRPPPELADW